MDKERDNSPDFTLFEDTSFSDLMKDIYITSKKKDEQIYGLIEYLKPLVRTIKDAEVAAPLIKEYLDVSVRNDEQLVKLASVVQRHLAAFARTKSNNVDSEFMLSEEEKQQLLGAALEDELKQLAKQN